MAHHYLFKTHAVLCNKGILDESAHGDHEVRRLKAAALDINNRLIGTVAAGTVVLRSVDMNDEGFAALLLRRNAGGKREPVVRMDNVKAFLSRQNSRALPVAMYFGKYI